ncbi:MAG: tetratricopeptide repeat protein, partial [Paramuribaculum sp.]|nr:tetratricopeptide repeat protein [Paramuribaculum sp.]
MTPDEAKQAFARGEYAEAAPILKSIADKAPKNTSANTMAGIALAKSGQTKEAKHYLARGINEAKLTLAEIAFDDYDFNEAEELVEKYVTAQKKARKPVSDEADR